MLTLADSRHLGDVTVFRDVSWGSGQRALTTTYYLLRDTPTVAAAADGGPDYAFFWYRAAPGAPGSGGLLTVAVTATPPATESDQLVAAIRAAYQLDAAVEVLLAPVPVSTGTVTLTFATEAAAGEFTDAVLGGGTARQTGSDVTTFVVELTADGAALLGQALAAGIAVVQAEFDLTVPYVLDDIALRVWCDVSSSCRLARDLGAGGPLTPGALSQALVDAKLAGTTLTSARPLDDDEKQALVGVSAALLAQVLPAALLDARGAAVPYSAALEQRLNLTLTATYPADLAVRRTAALSLPVDGVGRTTVFDLNADRLLGHYEITAAGDLTLHGITAIVVRLDYTGTTEDGAPIARSGEVTLRAGTPTAVTSFDLATPDQRTVRPHVEVHYADGSAPYAIDLSPSDSAVIALDVDTLGALVVGVALGAVDPATGPSAIVEFAYGADGSPWQATRIVTPAVPSATWTALVREPPAAYRYRVTWTAGPVRLVGDWQTSSARRIVLDAPADLTPPAAIVTVISAGDFDPVAAVLLELRATPTDPVSVLRFTAADQTATWTAGSSGPLAYQIRQSVLLKSGDHVVSAWQEEVRPVLIARDIWRLDIRFVTELLGLGTTASRAVIELGAPDPTSPTLTVPLDGTDQKPVGTIRLTDPTDHRYRYRTTLCPLTGPPHTSDWALDSSSVLVLRPPL